MIDYDYKKIKDNLSNDQMIVNNPKKGSSLEDFYNNHQNKIVETTPENEKAEEKKDKRALNNYKNVEKDDGVSRCGCLLL